MSARKNKLPRTLADFPPQVRALIREEAAREQVPPEWAVGTRRFKSLTLVRFRVWRRQRELTLPNGGKPSLPHMARMWGCDHTTIWNGLKRIEVLEAE